MRLKQLAKTMAALLFGKYQIVRIYCKDLDNVVTDVPHAFEFIEIVDLNVIYETGAADIKTHAWYGSRGAIGYGIIEDRKVVCTCWYWKKGDPRVPAGFFPRIQDYEAVMVDLLTTEDVRGHGYASALIGYSERRLREAGFRRLWTWVWHSNDPSIRTFEKSGWKYTGFIIEVQIFRTSRRIRLRLRPR